MNSFKLSGIAIAAGGVSLIIVNAVFTPMLAIDAPFPEMVASKIFLWRLSLAALTVFLLMIGSPGLYAYQTGHSGFFAIPLITAVTSIKWGGALGNAVLGSGFILLGSELFKSPAGAK